MKTRWPGVAVKRKRSLPGRNCPTLSSVSLGASDATRRRSPPGAMSHRATSLAPGVAGAETRRVPSVDHAPDSAEWLTMRWTMFVARSNRFTLFGSENASARLSGVQKMARTPSLSGTSRSSIVSSARIHSRTFSPARLARNASSRPSGESAWPASKCAPRGAATLTRKAGSPEPTAAPGPRPIHGETRAVVNSAPASVHPARESHGDREERPRSSFASAVSRSRSTALASSISRRASPMSDSRRPGSFVRQRLSSRRTDDDVPSGSAVQSGSVLITFASVTDTSSPSNVRRPVSIS